jgi:hypothetical protein
MSSDFSSKGGKLGTLIIGNVEGAIDPYDPELNHEVGVVSRLQTKKMAQPYSKLKVPNSISHVSVDDNSGE